MKKNILLLIYLYPLVSYGQSYVSQTRSETGAIAVFSIAQPDNLKIGGTPYLNEAWMKGSIKLYDQKAISLDSMNYNIYSGKIAYKRKGVEYNTVSNVKVQNFSVGNSHFLYSLEKNTMKNEIFEILCEGHFKLLKKYNSKIQKGKPSNGYNDATLDHYITTSIYYYKEKDLPAVQFKNKNKEIISLMNKMPINAFIKDNHLNAKTEDDLIAIFRYYNSK